MFAPPPPWGELVMTPREAFLGRQEVVPVREAVGRVAAESLAAYPPGIPNVLPGERLTVETLDYIQQALEHGGSLRGASDRAAAHAAGGRGAARPSRRPARDGSPASGSGRRRRRA